MLKNSAQFSEPIKNTDGNWNTGGKQCCYTLSNDPLASCPKTSRTTTDSDGFMWFWLFNNDFLMSALSKANDRFFLVFLPLYLHHPFFRFFSALSSSFVCKNYLSLFSSTLIKQIACYFSFLEISKIL